jgi:hypothetical protein
MAPGLQNGFAAYLCSGHRNEASELAMCRDPRLMSDRTTMRSSTCDAGAMSIETRAIAAGYRLARRRVNGQLVWWWQRSDDPEDTRQPCWLECAQALSYIDGVLQRRISFRDSDAG